MKTRFCVAMLFLASTAAAQDGKTVLEEIVARVNNEIVTLSELERSRAALRKEIEDDCRTCPAAEIDKRLKEAEKNLLRDLIDQSLLVQRAKDAGISVEPDVVKQLDQIRQQNNFATMEELEKAVTASGVGFEDFKANIRNRLLTQEVIRREVGSRIHPSAEEIRKYYEAHKNEFNRPEKVFVSELFVTTEGKTEAETRVQEQRARTLLDRVKRGEDFVELAKRFSDGSTAAQGGELGGFDRGQLAPEIDALVFKMNRGDMTDVIRTKTGFLILRVEQRYEAGIQPQEKVEPEIMNRLYMEQIQPRMREYLAKLRGESYVLVKPGYTDSAMVASTPIVEVEPQAEVEKGKKKKKKGGE